MAITYTSTSGTPVESVVGSLVPIPFALLGSAAPGSLGVTLPVFEADNSYTVVGARYKPNIQGSTTITVVVARVSTPLGSSQDICTSNLNLSGTVNIDQQAGLVSGSDIINLGPGDSIGIRPGTFGAASGVGQGSITLRRN